MAEDGMAKRLAKAAGKRAVNALTAPKIVRTTIEYPTCNCGKPIYDPAKHIRRACKKMCAGCSKPLDSGKHTKSACLRAAAELMPGI